MTNISPEIVARMEALVRKLASSRYGIIAADEARDIVALLPEPVDPDEEEAKDVAKSQGWIGCNMEGLTPAGILALAALKRGRELAAKDKA